MKDDASVFDCTFRGTGLRMLSTRGLMLHEDALDGDVVIVMSNVGPLGEVPKTAEFFRKLIEFSGNLDFCKVLFSERNIIISSLL
jgi:hypothetical protein